MLRPVLELHSVALFGADMKAQDLGPKYGGAMNVGDFEVHCTEGRDLFTTWVCDSGNSIGEDGWLEIHVFFSGCS